MAGEIVREMTYNVSSGRLNSTIPILYLSMHACIFLLVPMEICCISLKTHSVDKLIKFEWLEQN